jgi:dTDP-4-dehydrorhamnose 3,5-epimerase
MKLVETPIAGLFEAETIPFEDHRGSFARLFCADELRVAHGNRPIVQINHSLTRQVGAIRGMHFQRAPQAEAKWVRCLKGRVFDVAVDLRRGSPTFLHWHAVQLDGKRRNSFFLPEGFAHGFQVLEPDSELLYLHSAPYAPGLEGAVRWDDAGIGIAWPLPARDLSQRDMSHPLIDDGFEGLVI